MTIKLKKLSDQVIVITGASSGIGLVTARLAAKRGARMVLNARNEEALRQVTAEINMKGGEAIDVTGDVGRLEDVQRIADEAIRRFGNFTARLRQFFHTRSMHLSLSIDIEKLLRRR